MVEETFIWTEIRKKKKTGKSGHFPKGRGCKSWFFIMSAGTKLKCVFNYCSPNDKKNKNLNVNILSFSRATFTHDLDYK